MQVVVREEIDMSYNVDVGDVIASYWLYAIIVGVIFGLICKHIVKSKGYESGGFWWGFLLTWIGIIVCALKPEAPHSSSRSSSGSSSGGLSYPGLGSASARDDSHWTCKFCGRQNGNMYTTCGKCGRNKFDKQVAAPAVSQAVTAPVNTPSADNVAAQIKDYKKLLDEGIISEEEFAAKKKQILGI
jgi:hypothetical protein